MKSKIIAAAILYTLPVLSVVLALFDCKTISDIIFLVWFIPYILLFLFARKLKEYTARKIEEVKKEKEELYAELHPAETSDRESNESQKPQRGRKTIVT